MSRRSREAGKLGRGLSAYWGLGPGGVEVAWADAWLGGRYRLGYVLRWTDGPTVELMRTAAERLVIGGPAINALVTGGRVGYERSLSLGAWAAKLITHVRDGGQVPDLARPEVSQAWLAALERTDFPERARTAQDEELAAWLVERALRDYRQAVMATDRARAQGRRPAPWAPPEVLLACAVAADGLEDAAGIAYHHARARAAEAILDLDRYRQTRDLGRDGPALE